MGKYVAFWKIFQNIFSFLKKIQNQGKRPMISHFLDLLSIL